MWKNIDGYSAYEVSDKGVVRKRKTGFVLTPKRDKTVRLVDDNGICRYRSVTNLVAHAFVENPDNLKFALPIDPRKPLDPSNLRWSKTSSNSSCVHYDEETIRLTVKHIVKFKEKYKNDYAALHELICKSEANIMKQRENKAIERETRRMEKLQRQLETIQEKIQRLKNIRIAKGEGGVLGVLEVSK